MWPTGDDRKVYFLSDRDGVITLFAYDTATKKVTQAIDNHGLDIKSASASADAIVYEQFGRSIIYDLKSGKTKRVPVTINADIPSVRAKYEKVGAGIVNAGLSPTGARASSRRAAKSSRCRPRRATYRNLTTPPASLTATPPGRRTVSGSPTSPTSRASTRSTSRQQSGIGEVKKINLGNPPSFFYGPTWSPDSKKIAFTDKRLNLWYVDLDKGTPVKVDTSRGRPRVQRQLVARQPLDRVHQTARIVLQRGLHLLARGSENPASHRRFE